MIDELMTMAAYVPHSKKLRDFLERLKLEAMAVRAAAVAKIDDPETMKAQLAQARKMTLEGAMESIAMRAIEESGVRDRLRAKVEEDAKNDVLAIARYLQDGTVTPGYEFTEKVGAEP
jgi:hypothetical protein